MEYTRYHYQANVVSVYDGDTIKVNIDLGFRTWLNNERIRLSRIDAPEIRGKERPAGLASRDFLRNLIDGKEVIIQTIRDKQGKYGRYLAEVWLESGDGWININDTLVASGHAVYAEY